MKPKVISLGLTAVLLAAGVFIYLYLPPAQAKSDAAGAAAASPSAPAHMPIPPALPQSIYAGLWRVDHNFQASIHIKNLMTVNSVQVTPVLYMANGVEYVRR